MTNEEFVAHLMRYSPHGALCQVFVIEAIRAYVETIVEAYSENPNGFTDELQDKMGLISAEAWVGIAKDIQRRYKENYS